MYMKQGNRILLSALFAAMSTVALAQAGGSNGNGGTGGGNAHGAATAGPTVGGDPASGSKAKSHISHKSKMAKSATDTTNMPGADASSDTKGR
jgi:hypothetical protein